VITAKTSLLNLKKNKRNNFSPNLSNNTLSKILRFDESNFHQLCNHLAKQDQELRQIILEHGHPPLFKREASFETLIHIILEQQVSLASAKAALVKLQEKIGKIHPEKLLLLTDEELRSCYFSRQKTAYAKCLANAIICKELNLTFLDEADDDTVRTELKKNKRYWRLDSRCVFNDGTWKNRLLSYW
jgi:DNA-3-methyladenine glycosylase II